MATFGELQSRVRANIIDLPSNVSSRVPDLINQAIRELEDRHNFIGMQAFHTPISTIGTNSLGTLPTNWKESYGDATYISDPNTNENLPLKWLGSYSQGAILFPSTRPGPPQLLNNPTATSLFVLPFPDGRSLYSDGEYRFFIPYYSYLPELVNSGDTNFFTDRASLYIEQWATGEAFPRNWDEERAAFWKQLAENSYISIRNTDKRRQLQGITTLVPHWQGARSPEVPL